MYYTVIPGAIVITIHAHLANMAQPGTFGKTVRNLLKLNNLPDGVLPEDAPSFEIFGTINGLRPTEIPPVQVQHGVVQCDYSDSEEVDVETDIDIVEDVGEANGLIAQKDTTGQLDVTAQLQQSSQMITVEGDQREQIRVGIRFITSEEDNVPES